ncbi:MAG: HAMP domain-containing histidine kinase [Clostridia bacterium]|nr:HAMP domain-containing histidine kinase [Clostridia bacterium]
MVGYILSGFLLLILAGIVIRHLCNNRRLKQLSENMEDYLVGIGGNLPLSLKEDTIAQVENAAMEMQNRIDVAEERFRQEAKRTSNLTADISHQLKTPLASLRLYCEMDSSPHCEQQIIQIERMETLISSLLRLERLCADGYQFEYAECDLRKMIERDWQQMHPLWPGRTLTIEGEAMIRCDEKWLAEAFRNLIKNACEHTAEDGHIRIFMETTDKFLYCTLEDDGGGADPKDLPHLFDRFYRAEGQSKKGAGLGLAIVKEIIYRHHGQILAQNTKKGLKFTISMPLLDMINK